MSAVDRICEGHVPPTDRARAALRRLHLEPKDYPALIREIAKEICEAEQTIFKGLVGIARSEHGRRFGVRVCR